MSAIELPSDTADYRFRFSANVGWQQPSREIAHGDPAALAREAILSRAALITTGFSLADRGLAEHRLAAALGAPEPDAQRQVQAWATDIVLDVDDQDATQLRRLADLRKGVQLWDHERGHEINVRRYLSDDVLGSAGSALVWWLSHDADNRIDRAAERIAPLARISAVVRGDDDPGPDPATPRVFRVVPDDGADPGPGQLTKPGEGAVAAATALIDQLLPDGDDDERRVLADHLARSADESGLREFGARLRESYGLYPLDDPLPDEPDPWDEGSHRGDGSPPPEDANGSEPGSSAG